MPKLHVLVADDDPDTLRTVTRCIEALGADVAQAHTGDELIQLLADETFDVVVTDVAMPWMSGLQAMHSVRTAGVMTPIVVITGLRDAQVVRQVEALGAGATLLYKPFSIEQIHDAVARVLGGAQLAAGNVK